MNYRVHVRVEWRAAKATRGTILNFRTLKEVEALFERQCSRVGNNRLTEVTKIEVKQGHKVLFMQRFENGVRL